MRKNDHDTQRRYGRSRRGTRADIVENFIRGDRYSLLAALSLDGYLAADVVPGSFNKELFYDFVQEPVLREIQCQGLHKLLPPRRGYPCRLLLRSQVYL